MAYLYGDSTESPLEFNYIEFLRDALDFSVEILVSDHRVHALQESCDEHKRGAEAELQQLRALNDRMAKVMAEPFGAPQSAAQRCAAQIRQGAEDAILRMAGQIKQALSDQLAQVAQQVQRERSSPLRAIETLLRHRDLPDSTSHVEVMLASSRTAYGAQVRGRADIGLEWVQALDIPASNLFGQLVKVERLSPNLEIRLPEKGGGWRRKGVRVRAHRIGGLYVTELVHAPHQTTVKIRATPEEDEAGYNILIAAAEPRVRLVQVQKGGEHTPPFEPMDEDSIRFVELAQLLTESAAELQRSRGSLREARIDGKGLGEVENPSVLVKRLVTKMAPVVTEIARHSLAPDELVLKRVVRDDRREEIFAAKADLIAKLDPVPMPLRGVFAPLGLGDLGHGAGGGPASRAYAATEVRKGRPERMDTNEPTETKEVRPSPRTSELPPMSGLPGIAPSAPSGPHASPAGPPGPPSVTLTGSPSGPMSGSPSGPMPGQPSGPLSGPPSGPMMARAAERPPLAAGSAASRGSAGPANPTMRGVSPLGSPPTRPPPNGFGPPPGSAVPRVIEPASRPPRGSDDDDVTIVSDREKSRPHVMPSTEDSIDVALSELELEQNRR